MQQVVVKTPAPPVLGPDRPTVAVVLGNRVTESRKDV
jgi:hypothetical protein